MNLELIFNISVTNIFSLNRLLNSPVGITTHRKNRENWAIVLKAEGRTVYNIGSQKILSDSTHPVILPKGCSYSWKCLEPGECLIIEFEAASSCEKIFSFEITESKEIKNLFEKIERRLSRKNNSYLLECKSLIYSIFTSLVKSQDKKYTPKTKQQILNPALFYIANNYYDTKISNDYLAGLCGISTVYFRKLFQSLFNISPMKYLQNLRIEKAKNILLSDYESITQVAESVGFSSIYHFSKTFRQQTDLSPMQFVKKQDRNFLDK